MYKENVYACTWHMANFWWLLCIKCWRRNNFDIQKAFLCYHIQKLQTLRKWSSFQPTLYKCTNNARYHTLHSMPTMRYTVNQLLSTVNTKQTQKFASTDFVVIITWSVGKVDDNSQIPATTIHLCHQHPRCEPQMRRHVATQTLARTHCKLTTQTIAIQRHSNYARVHK